MKKYENIENDDLYERGLKNKVPDLRLIDEDEIKHIEPHCRGMQAIHSPHTGIVDWELVTEYYAKDFENAGGQIFTNFEVKNFKPCDDPDFPVMIVDGKNQKISAKYILTCAGLQADKIAGLTGNKNPPKIVPFRGEYLLLNPKKAHLIKGNIYPVPDPRFPFLGVHFTPRMNGEVWLGPNAVLAFKREGYTWFDINLFELFDALKYPGLIRMATRYIGAGIKEISQSLFPALQVKELQKYVPEITTADVSRGPAGVRAQALKSDGSLVDDFIFEYGEGSIGNRILHCCNAPSPGATSSLAIAKMISDKVESSFRFIKRN
ncbi:CLUMA_CG013677, isoform A [Clunio marinus]|uniref:L-2-hydroxyglutarate dehydrogenase, mitochondrial n=1 Tax=Clunio marinus TaxID=568069 RepID=A0A1J1IKW3_9DIPT|nr:CLUMA_CG013677, isoform A [Clunio marinus]